jgi:hypothetical protein
MTEGKKPVALEIAEHSLESDRLVAISVGDGCTIGGGYMALRFAASWQELNESRKFRRAVHRSALLSTRRRMAMFLCLAGEHTCGQQRVGGTP